MVKVTLVKFVSNIAYGLGGGKRQNFKKGDQVIVGKEDVLPLRRLGCEILDEVDVNFKDNKDLFKKSKKEKVEAPADITPVVTEEVKVEVETEVETPAEQVEVKTEETEKVEAPAETEVKDEVEQTA